MRRIVILPMFAFAVVSASLALAITYICDLATRFGTLMREVTVWAIEFIPRLAKQAQPARRIGMAATALNGRQVGGVRVHGFLGRPAVQMLAG
ncbi:MAG: hypothetical protein JWS10_932 [Cypionkella sp.]|uniref:hypothetical protein n=1 Tax=Cypionkella sp. TaxID=2811411 RepID=UPI0026361345|nr:hypothetical protein [Cypionkella sp.]MDB5658317.1 hypothetical protein [Cypionkella sp.]